VVVRISDPYRAFFNYPRTTPDYARCPQIAGVVIVNRKFTPREEDILERAIVGKQDLETSERREVSQLNESRKRLILNLSLRLAEQLRYPTVGQLSKRSKESSAGR